MSKRMTVGTRIGIAVVGIYFVAGIGFAADPVTNVYVGPMTNNATLNWLWTTQYQFNVESPENGAVTGTANDWYDTGTAIDITANPDQHYQFLQWQNVPGGTSTNNPLGFSLSSPYTNVAAVFALKQYTVTVNSDHGTASPGTESVTALQYSQQSMSPETVSISSGVRVRLSGYQAENVSVSTNAP